MDTNEEKLIKKGAEEIGIDPLMLDGENSKGWGIFKVFLFNVNAQATKGMNEEQIEKIARKTLVDSLEKYCATIGWWPHEDYKQYSFFRDTSGAYALVAFLKKSIVARNAKGESEIKNRIEFK
jgi:hypothetical protein